MIQYLRVALPPGEYLLSPFSVSFISRFEFLLLYKQVFLLRNFRFRNLLFQLLDAGLSPSQVCLAVIISFLCFINNTFKTFFLFLVSFLLRPGFLFTVK